MEDTVGTWRRSGWPGWWRLSMNTIFGCRRADGSRYWTRGEYLKWVWKAFIRKWLRAPVSCKFGTHLIGERSDTGMGG